MTGTSRPSPFQTMSGTFLKCQQKLAIEDSLHLSQTKAECGKKRSLPIKDPSLVQDKWECKDSGGTEEQVCGEQVHVGSLVLARIEEWLTWPAMVPMVDNDPDTWYFSGQGSGENGRLGLVSTTLCSSTP